MNVGAWRFRADWQGNYSHRTDNSGGNEQNWSWNRYYLYRSIAAARAKLTLGEDYLSSDMFDSFRYTGASLISDDSMLPPNLRGYAPEVVGIAKTNAKVTISQQGRVIYETTVAAGPFRIQDLSNAISGKLDVKVAEEDGSSSQYQIDTATIPYLSRPDVCVINFQPVNRQVMNIIVRGRCSAQESFLGGHKRLVAIWRRADCWRLYGFSFGGGA